MIPAVIRYSTSLCLLLLVVAPAGAEPQAAPVRAAKVIEKEVRQGRRFVGSARPFRRTDLASGVEGFVASLMVREGQRVEQDEIVARLDLDVLAPELEAARAELLRIDHVIKELESGTRKELITEAEARLAEADVEVRTAQRRLETAKRLQSKSHVSGEEVRDASDAVRGAEAAKRRITAALEFLRSGTREEKIDQARADRMRQVASVKRFEALEARHTVKASFAGYVVKEHTEEGAWLSRGDPIVTIEALDTVRVRFPVLEDYVNALAPGVDVAVQFGALPDRLFQGTIERIVPSADLRARTVPVDVIVTNERTPHGVVIKPGMFAQARLPVGAPMTALLVPLDALVLGGRSPMVYLIGEDMTVAPVPVELTGAVDGHAVVKGPLKPGMRVVTEGNERLRPGQLVTILER